MRIRLFILIICFSLIASAASAAQRLHCNSPEQAVTRSDTTPISGRAISLTALQAELKACNSVGHCPDSVLKLHGLTRLRGYVIDQKHHDIILVGTTTADRPPLYLDDFVVALQHALLRYARKQGNTYIYSPIGCSIDPHPEVLAALEQVGDRISRASGAQMEHMLREWDRVCVLPQRVRILGIPRSSRTSRIMVTADYDMKRLVDGSLNLDLPGFMSLTDLTLNQLISVQNGKKQQHIPLSTLNRFWFYPGEQQYAANTDIVMLKRSPVTLLTEEQFVSRERKIVGTGSPSPLAEEFAECFTANYNAIAKKLPIYAELEALFRHVALVTLMKENQAFLKTGIGLQYLIDTYQVQKDEVPAVLPGIAHVKRFKHHDRVGHSTRFYYAWLPSCGGVAIHIQPEKMKPLPDRSGTLATLAQKVLASRPDTVTVYWDFIATFG